MWIIKPVKVLCSDAAITLRASLNSADKRRLVGYIKLIPSFLLFDYRNCSKKVLQLNCSKKYYKFHNNFYLAK